MPILVFFKIAVILAVAALNFFLGYLVLLRNPKNRINIIFFLLAFFYGLWSLALLFYDYPVIFTSYFWIKATYFSVIIFEILTLGFSFVFPKAIFKKTMWLAIIGSFAYFVFSFWLLFLTDYWVAKVYIDPNRGLQTIIGPAYLWWVGATWVILGWAVINYLINAVRSSGKQKEQLIILLIGFTLWGIVINAVDVIIPLVFGETRYFSISSVSSLFFALSVAFAILKHRFLDMKLAIIRSLVYLSLLATISAFYIACLYLIIHLSPVKNFDSWFYVFVSTALALLVVFTFHPTLHIIEKVVNKFIHYTYYDSDDLLYSLTQVMAEKVELKDVILGVLGIIRENMHIAMVSVGVNSDNQPYSKYVSPDGEIGFGFTKDEIKILENTKKMLIAEEMPAGEIKQIMLRESAKIFIPLKIKDNLTGYLILSEKTSGDTYFPQDINVLEMLAPEFAVAMENAQEYEQIKEFNETLKIEIDRATKQVVEANEKLKILDKLKDDFVSIASHELRTPMTAIKSYLWLAIHKKKQELTPDMGRYLTRALNSTDRLINLVNDMLNVSRIESGRIGLNLTEVNLAEIADEVEEELAQKAAEKGVKIILMLDHVPTVLCDKNKIIEVFLNLVGNSLKFTPEGGKISIKFAKKLSYVVVTIADTGRGIIKEDLPKLFTKFGRLDNSYVAVGESGGTGLGLYISKSLVNLHEGKIWVESAGAGKGASFSFSLPIFGSERAKELMHVAPKETENSKQLEKINIDTQV